VAGAPRADRRLGPASIALDLPGFGEAGLEAGPQSPWEDVLQTLRLLTSEPVALAGNSYGGAIALRVAAIAPSAVAAMALVSAPAPGADEEPSEELAAIWEAEESALEDGDVERAVEAVVDGWTLPGAGEELRERIAAMQRRAFLLQEATPGADIGPDPLEDRIERLSELRMPVLCSAGTQDKPDFVAGAKQMAELLPEGRHATIARAGHLAPLEQPRAFRRQLLGFLDDAAPV
jgi:pimeloyl-ACP methyl ester carboxylesterase